MSLLSLLALGGSKFLVCEMDLTLLPLNDLSLKVAEEA